MSARLFRLTESHQKIDAALRDEQRRRAPDWFRLVQLKKLKLRAKDLMHRLARAARR